MKNLLLSIVACAISFAATFFALKKYAQPKLFNNTTEQYSNQEIASNANYSDNNQTEETEEENQSFEANINGDEIEKDYKKWYTYNENNIELSNDFTAVDVDNNEIEKEDFLSKLKTGFYIPLKVETDDITYKLFKLDEKSADKKIGKFIRGQSSIAYAYFKKEGQSLPKFDWVDLNGNEYTSLNTRGKIKVIKCWFINCVVCVQEFPELNELYDFYEGNDKVQFISLAFDKANKLTNFLARKEFRFPVVAEQKKYMSKELEIKQYPTHIIVDEDNNIIKMVSNVKALTSFLDQIVGNDEIDTGDDNEEKVETQEE